MKRSIFFTVIALLVIWISTFGLASGVHAQSIPGYPIDTPTPYPDPGYPIETQETEEITETPADPTQGITPPVSTSTPNTSTTPSEGCCDRSVPTSTENNPRANQLDQTPDLAPGGEKPNWTQVAALAIVAVFILGVTLLERKDRK